MGTVGGGGSNGRWTVVSSDSAGQRHSAIDKVLERQVKRKADEKQTARKNE